MRVLIIGANGALGQAAVGALKGRHEIVTAGRTSGDVKVDLLDRQSIVNMYKEAGKLDAVVACTGHAHFGPLATMTDEQFMVGLKDKLMGQVNVVLIGQSLINDKGSFTLTGGVLDRDPIRKGANASAVNGALNAFAMSAAIELERQIRINVVSPTVLDVSAKKYDGFFPGHVPVSSERVGIAYVKSVEGAITGQVIKLD
ncbi:short chain dehydrogenase [Taklimakanibacter lacteus]|uniref:short chain dehydrogenase n=1 Tax=Taklimakanibacter lacteus TaxID=2268456 RepID=UPI000E66E14A